MAGSRIELLLAARNEASRELKLLRGEIHELRNAIVGMNEKTKESNEKVKKSYIENANTIEKITQNIRILQEQQKKAVIGSEEFKNSTKKLKNEQQKLSAAVKNVGKSYIKNARTINDITHNIKILHKQQKSAVIGSKEYTSSIKRLREEQKKLASATGKMGAQGVQQFNRMRIATSGLRRTLGAVRNQILVFLFAWRMIKGALDIGTEAIQVSKDAEEIQNKFDVVFKSVKDVTNDWAESFADSVGRARQDVKKFSSEIGDILKPLGFATTEAAALSKQLVEWSLDVASFNNRLDTDVIQATISALTGMRRPLKGLGIDINEADIKQEAYTAGLVQQGEELSKTAKAQATINLMFRNSVDAQGDLARTSESLVNVEKRRNAEYKNMLERWGKKLIPLAKTWNKLLISMYELTKPAVNKLAELQRTMAGFERQEKNLNMMIVQFQNLKDRTGKSNEEIDRMNGLMQKLGEAFPVAATFNDAGEVIDINIEKLKKYIELQKEVMRLNLIDKMADTFGDFVGFLKDADQILEDMENYKTSDTGFDYLESQLERLSTTTDKFELASLEWMWEGGKRLAKELGVANEKMTAFKDKLLDAQKPIDVIVKRIMSVFEEPEKVTAIDLAAELGLKFKDNEKSLNRLLARWKELQKVTSEGLGEGGKKAGSLFNEKELETLEKNLKKLYAELGKEQITLGALDIDEGFERATYILEEQIDQRIELLEDERQKLFDHYVDKKDMSDADLEVLKNYNDKVVKLEEIKNAKLETLKKQYSQEFNKLYADMEDKGIVLKPVTIDDNIEESVDLLRKQINEKIELIKQDKAIFEKSYDDKDRMSAEYIESVAAYDNQIIALQTAKNEKLALILKTGTNNLKKIYKEISGEGVDLGGIKLDVDIDVDSSLRAMEQGIDATIAELDKEKNALIEHYADKKEWNENDLEALKKYNDQVVELEEIKNAKLETLKKQYRQKFDEAYQDAEINAIEDSMERQIAVYEQGYEDQKILYDEYLEHKIISTEQHNAMLLHLEKAKNDKINDLRQKQLDKDEQDYLNYFKDMAAMSSADYELQKKLVDIAASERSDVMLDLRQRGLINAQEWMEAEVAISQWGYEQKRAILLKQWEDANHLWLEPMMAGFDALTSKVVESMGIQDSVISAMVSSLANIAMEWIKEQVKMALFSDTMKALEVVKMTAMGTKIAAGTAVAAANVGTMTMGGASVAAGLSYSALLALIQGAGTVSGVGVGPEAGATPAGPPAAQRGMYIDKEQIVHVGENGEEEVIIPISKFVPFLAGDYSLPGGFGIEHIPMKGLTTKKHPSPLRYAEAGEKERKYYNEEGGIAGLGLRIPDISNVYRESPVSSHFSSVNNYINNVSRSQIETFKAGSQVQLGNDPPSLHSGATGGGAVNIRMDGLEKLMRSNTNAIKAMNMNLVSKDMKPNIHIESKIDGEKFVLKHVKAIENELTRRGVNLDDA